MIPQNLYGAPFDAILDVGGNIGEFAEEAHERWPAAKLISFEPLHGAAVENRKRANGRWQVYELAIGEWVGEGLLRFCTNQHPASTMQPPGPARYEHFGITDRFVDRRVDVKPLDRFYNEIAGCQRLLVKIDVEGHERAVLRGATRTLNKAMTVVCEVQNDGTIFLGSPSAHELDELLRARGLRFAGLVGAFCSPKDESVLQFDGVWTRAYAPLVGPFSVRAETF